MDLSTGSVQELDVPTRPLLAHSPGTGRRAMPALDADGINDNVVKPRGIKARLVAYVIVAVLGGVLFGFEISIFSGAQLLVQNDQGFTAMRRSSVLDGVVTAGMVIGAFLGSSVAGFFQEWSGRRMTAVLAGSIYMLGVGVSLVSSTPGVLLLGRIVTGSAVGIFSTTVPVYVAELSPPHIRGVLVTSNQLFICVGVLLGFIIDYAFSCPHDLDMCYYASIAAWRWMLMSATPIALLLVISFVTFMPRSPRWLVHQGRLDDARRVLNSVRIEDNVELELDEILDSVSQQAPRWKDLLKPNVLYGLYIGNMMSFLQQFTGVNAVNFYAQTVLTLAGFSKHQAFFFSIFIGVAKVVFVGTAMLLIDRYGRRVLLIAGTAGMAVCIGTLAIVFQIRSEHHNELSTAMGYVALVSLLLYMAFFETGLGPAVWLLLAELFPLKVRGKALSISGGTNWLFTFIVGQVFPLAVKAWTPAGVFFVFAGMCVLSCVWIVRVLPETKGKTLEQLEAEIRAKRAKK